MEEMDVDEVNYNEDSIEDESVRQLGVDGYPEAHPGIGDEYQVEIPPLMTKSDYLSLTDSSTDAEVLGSNCRKFLVGLPISLVWVCEKAKSIKREPREFVGVATVLAEKDEPPLESGCTRTNIFTEGDELKPKVDSNIMSGGCSEFRGSNEFLRQDIKGEMLQNVGDKGYSLVPGSLIHTWSTREEASFLLGLYIFGKDLVSVKKFVETKSMGDVLSFYYEKFYKSDKYRRWAGCRKISSSRRCIFGQKIFTGPRQQELSSRLLPRLSDQCQSTLEEASKMFGEGKMSLEEYVVSLKKAVGLDALIEAVGIGKGKQDLTGIASEPPKSNQVGHARPEVPVGKACSFLTPLEITNFLTGDYRLSKARSSDLFWEAVWPRLLNRGWHSEQPNDNGCAAISKHSLVFLVPGIKKFSRRKLVKGCHYFDSVTDVLTKVASDPTVLELELGADKSYSSKGENGWTNGINSVQDTSPDQHRHCYLKPRTPNRGAEVLKFTVVDTSLAAYGEAFKVREMRSLPVELLKISTSRSRSVEDDENSSESSSDETDSADSSSFDRDKISISNPIKANFEKRISSERIRFEHTAPKQKNPVNGSDSINISAKPSSSHNRSPHNEMQQRKAIKGQSRQTMKPDNMPVPITKRRRGLTTCNRKERNPSAVIALAAPTIKQQKTGFLASNPNLVENILPQVHPSGERLSSTTCLSKRSPNDVGEGMHNGASSGAEFSSFLSGSIQNNIGEGITYGTSSVAGGQHDKPESRVLFDLNVAAVPNAETDDPSLMGMTGKHDEEGTKANEHSPLENSACMEQPPSMNSRRHSTRNRPPTARALEALAFGFLSVKPKRKSRDAFYPESSRSRPRRSRAKLRVIEDSNIDAHARANLSVMEDSSTDALAKLTAMEDSSTDAHAKLSAMENSSANIFGEERRKGICNSSGDVLSEVEFESMETNLK